ncbi:MAG: hypothetical protein M1825_002110 [Sarcosagium campestre]|nr:MAG: hypothetical protein M1825_002110 [Sarcosagium campestre]
MPDDDSTADGSIPSPPVAGSDYVPAKDTFSKWRNAFAALSGQMSNEGMQRYRRDLEIQNEATDCKRCEDQTLHLFKHSERSSGEGLGKPQLTKLPSGPIIRFLSSRIQQLHGDIGPHNVYCRRCTVQHTGGFSPDHGIQLCANAMRNRGHVEDTLAHEMMHAWDHLRFKVDWQDLRHAACSEVIRNPFSLHSTPSSRQDHEMPPFCKPSQTFSD